MYADVHFSAPPIPRKKVIKSTDVHFSAQKQVNTKKKVIKSADVHFFAQKQVKTKKRSSRPQAVVCTETFRNFSWKHDLTCFHCS